MQDYKESIDNVITAFRSIGTELSFKKICEYSDLEKQEYNRLLDDFKKKNSSKCSMKEKGDSLENIASFVLKSGNIFEVYKNVRTSTNELDQLVKTTVNGSILCSNGILDSRLSIFIGECKNYSKGVSVTYVGKVCSLLQTMNIKICILFSYKGITGSGWKDASGLVKKFYMSKENQNEKYCIIDFNISDFESIKSGNNFLKIIEDKIMALKIDTDYTTFLSGHEAEKLLV